MKSWIQGAVSLAALTLAACSAGNATTIDAVEDGSWHVTLNSGFMGVMEMQLALTERGNTITAHADAASAQQLAALVAGGGTDADRAWHARDGIASISLHAGQDGSYTGTLTTPLGVSPMTVHFDDRTHFSGQLDRTGSPISGELGGSLPVRDFHPIAEAITATMQDRLYDPSLLESAGWQAFEHRLDSLATLAQDDLTFFFGIHLAWDDATFSHFRVWRPMISTDDMFAAFEAGAAQAPAARYETLSDGTGLITLDHFVGDTVIAQVNAAFDAAAEAGVDRLIIDMRENGGGAFAALEVVDRLVGEEMEYGYFAGAPWWRQHDRAPTAAERDAIAPFRGTSVAEFMDSVTNDELLVLRTQPRAERFEGPVAVLVSGTTASAAELISELLQRSGRAVLIGTQTQGALLSGSFADLPDGYKLFLPVADYYTAEGVRVEGHGLTPDIAVVDPAEALDTALAYLTTAH